MKLNGHIFPEDKGLRSTNGRSTPPLQASEKKSKNKVKQIKIKESETHIKDSFELHLHKNSSQVQKQRVVMISRTTAERHLGKQKKNA